MTKLVPLMEKSVGDSALCFSWCPVQQELLGSCVINSELSVFSVDLSTDEMKLLIWWNPSNGMTSPFERREASKALSLYIGFRNDCDFSNPF